MADTPGDPSKQPASCNEDTHCPNIECLFEGIDEETWECSICGARFKIYYDELR